eukprot:2598580-Rhodomonas_salina.5
MLSTARAYGAINTTELAHGATRGAEGSHLLTCRPCRYQPTVMLRARSCYAMSGTDIAYGAVQILYAMCGTGLSALYPIPAANVIHATHGADMLPDIITAKVTDTTCVSVPIFPVNVTDAHKFEEYAQGSLGTPRPTRVLCNVRYWHTV